MLDYQSRSVGLPPECAPSPRTVARAQAAVKPTADRYRKQAINRGWKHNGTVPDAVASEVDDASKSTDRPSTGSDRTPTVGHIHTIHRRSYPIVHPPCEIPFCETCRQMDADMAASAAAGSEMKTRHSPSPQTPVSDDDESRSWIFKQLPGPWWWCEDCQALVSSPEITIAHLFAVLRQWTPYAQLQLITIVDEILRRGAHVDDRDGLTDMTLLHFAAKSGALGDEESACRIAEFLLDNGANLEARCKWTDMTALHYAAYFDCPMLIELLVRRGAQLDARSQLSDGATPLHFAATQLSLGSARALLHASAVSLANMKMHFADKDSVDALGRTPYQCLPPVNQLAEPLCSLRDRLAELLGPVIRHTNGSELESTSGNMDISTALLRPIGMNGFSTPSSQCNGHGPQPSAPPDGMSWLVAESGYLSPRVPRVPPPPVTEARVSPIPSTPPVPKQSIASQHSTNSLPRPSTAPVKSVALNHPLPVTSSISAKVTLQSLGLALNDRVCIGPGNTGSSRTQGRDTGPVAVSGRIGRLRYCGPVAFASGIWVGVELDEPLGRNNGTVAGVHYFSCAPNYGVFAPIGRVYKAVCDGTSTQQWLPLRQSTTNRVRPGTRQPTPQSPDPGRNQDDAMTTAIRVSRSSYSLSGSFSSGETEPSSHHSGGASSIVSHPPVDVSHVTAKVDTGLRLRSPEINAASRQFELGDRVLVAGQRKGIIRFIGPTQFAPGIWYGVELDQAAGKNNGSVAGVRYFECPMGHGIFAAPSRLQRLPNTSRSATPQCGRANSVGLRQASLTGSLYGSSGTNGQRLEKPTHRLAWSTTTSPMVGRAIVGRPTLPQELLNALHAAGHTEKEIKDPPLFYLSEGMQVLCAGEIGTIRYIGPIALAQGIWLGIELRKQRGRHDGSVAGKRYFTCRPGHGLLVRPSRVFCRGINAVDLLPPPLAAIERELAEKRLIKDSRTSSDSTPQ